MAAAGLVADEHVADAAVDERVVGGQVCAARVAEYDLDALCLEAVHDGVDCAHDGGVLSGLAARRVTDGGAGGGAPARPPERGRGSRILQWLAVPKTALIVVDMVQTYDFTDGDKLAANVEEMLPDLKRLLEKAREAGALVIYVNDSFGDWSTDRDKLVEMAS